MSEQIRMLTPEESVEFTEALKKANEPEWGNISFVESAPLSTNFDLTFIDLGELSIQDDITPVEATKIGIMVAIGSSGFSRWDFKTYATDNGLLRHFKLKGE
jgi:hypothetical protein